MVPIHAWKSGRRGKKALMLDTLEYSTEETTQTKTCFYAIIKTMLMSSG